MARLRSGRDLPQQQLAGGGETGPDHAPNSREREGGGEDGEKQQQPRPSLTSLPVEIQLAIWAAALAAQEPRVLRVWRAKVKGTQMARPRPEPLTQVCHRSRLVATARRRDSGGCGGHGSGEATLIAQVGEGTCRGAGTWLDGAKDAVLLRGSILEDFSLDAGVCGLAGLEGVRRLVVAPRRRHFDDLRKKHRLQRLFLALWRYFPGLAELYVAAPGAYLTALVDTVADRLDLARLPRVKIPAPKEDSSSGGGDGASGGGGGGEEEESSSARLQPDATIAALDRIVLASPTKTSRFWKKVGEMHPADVRGRVRADVRVVGLVSKGSSEYEIREE